MFGKKGKNKCMGYSLNPVYDAKLGEIAEILGISKSEVLRRAIDEYYFKVVGFYKTRQF
jgi:hypothetical protein